MVIARLTAFGSQKKIHRRKSGDPPEFRHAIRELLSGMKAYDGFTVEHRCRVSVATQSIGVNVGSKFDCGKCI